MDASTSEHVISQVGRLLDAETIYQNRKITMAISPTLKGLGAKLSKFKHDVEYDAEQLSAEIDGAQVETASVFAGAHGALVSHKQDLEDVKSFVAEIAQATNGGPALDPPAALEPATPVEHGVGPTPVLHP